MVALTINWTKVAMYLAFVVLFLLAGAVCGVLFMVCAVVAYAALCMGLRVAAALVFGVAMLPLAGLVLLAMAFWQDHRCRRLKQALGGPIL